MLTYQIKKPKIESDKNPLIILLHGYGSNEYDLFSFANELSLPSAVIISFRAPIILGAGNFAWYNINLDANIKKISNIDEAQKSLSLIIKSVEKLQKEVVFDINNIILIGFSQGAILSYALSFYKNNLFKKVAALSGYLNLDIVNNEFDLQKLKENKYFISHGEMDPVIPFILSQNTKSFFKENSLNFSYYSYPTGHTISIDNFNALNTWLEIQ